MKIRSGFVSNSSSSSYIVIDYGRPKEKCPICGIRLDWRDHFRSPRWGFSGDATEIETDDPEGVLEHLGYLENDGEREEVKRAIKRKLDVAVIAISYHDEASLTLLETLHKWGAINLIPC